MIDFNDLRSSSQPSKNSDSVPSTSRRFFSFSLRTMLLAMLIVAILFGFIAYRLENHRRLQANLQELIAAEANIAYQYEAGPWFRQILKDDLANSVLTLKLNNAKPDHLTTIGQFRSLDCLDLRSVQEVDLAVLSELTQLEQFFVQSPRIINLQGVEGMTQLTHLNIIGLASPDISALAGLTKLESLSVKGTQISDISAVAGMKSLSLLQISGGGVSDLTPLASSSASYVNLCPGVSFSTAVRGTVPPTSTVTIVGTSVSDLTPLAEISGLSIYTEESRDLKVPESFKGEILRIPDDVIEIN